MDSNGRSDLRVLVRLFPGHDGRSDDRVLQQPRDRPTSDLPADFCRGYRGPKITCSIEAADTTPIGAPFGLVSSGFMYAWGQSRRFDDIRIMSVFPLIATEWRTSR